MTELLLLIPIIALSLLLWLEKNDRAQERKERDAERDRLLDRIQAPEKIAQEYEPSDIHQYVPFDDDEAFWKAKELNG